MCQAPLGSLILACNLHPLLALQRDASHTMLEAHSAAVHPSCVQVAADLYRDMFLGREFEEMCAQMYYRGKMFGFVHLYSGQEAVSTGVIRHLRQDDYICSTYRDHVHALSKNVPPRCASSPMLCCHILPPSFCMCGPPLRVPPCIARASVCILCRCAHDI